MRLRQLFESTQTSVAFCFGRFNPAHQGHMEVWNAVKQAGQEWFVGTNPTTVGPNDPLPFDVKSAWMKAIDPELEGHLLGETSILTLASKIFEQVGEGATISYVTDAQDWQWSGKLLNDYNGKQATHGYYNFTRIQHVVSPRVTSATDLRNAARAGDEQTFYRLAGVDPSLRVNGKSYFDAVVEACGANPEKVKRAKKEKAVAEGKKPEHNLGPGWMLDKDKVLGQKVDQARARYSELYKTTQRVDPRTGKKIVQKGVAEGSDEAEKYKAQLLKTAPRIMDFLAKTVKGWRPSEEEMLSAIDTAYMVMKHTGDVKQAGKAMMDELNTLHRMSQGQQGVAEAESNAMDTVAKRLTDPKDGMTAKLRAAGDKRREEHLKGRNIAKKNEDVNSIKYANKVIREMRAQEFVTEGHPNAGTGHTTELASDHDNTMKGASRSRDIGGFDRVYHLNRMMMAMAMHDGKGTHPVDSATDTWFEKYNTMHPMTQEEDNMIRGAMKTVPTDGKHVSKFAKSKEADGGNKISPVAQHKKNKYGI